jgi:uncharacterized protein YqeY
LKLIDRINEDIIRSMKAKDGTRVSVLRFLMASIQGKEKDKKEALEEEEVLAEIQSAAKRRKESLEAFSEGGRQDLVDKEAAELVILEEYLPEQLSEDEIRSAVQETVAEVGAESMADLGKVMKELMPKLQGRADGKLASQIVREVLSG